MRDDRVYLLHVRDEVAFLEAQVKGLAFRALVKDPVLQRACLRSLEVIGEAVKNLSVRFREQHGAVEWKKLAGLRDVLIHHYFGVDWKIVWDVLQTKIPALGERIRDILAEMEPTR